MISLDGDRDVELVIRLACLVRWEDELLILVRRSFLEFRGLRSGYIKLPANGRVTEEQRLDRIQLWARHPSALEGDTGGHEHHSRSSIGLIESSVSE